MDWRDVEDILDRHPRRLTNWPGGEPASFVRVDLRGFDFAGRNLCYVRFVGCEFRGARLSLCDLRYADLVFCDLRGADLRGALAQEADFHGSDLRGADLRDLFDLSGSRFVAADLRGARMKGMQLQQANLRGAWMAPADVRGAYFFETRAPSGALLDEAIGPDTDRADLAAKFQRMAPHPGTVDSPFVAAYELGSGPALLHRLRAAEERLTHGQAGPAPARGEEVLDQQRRSHELLGQLLRENWFAKIWNDPYRPLHVQRHFNYPGRVGMWHPGGRGVESEPEVVFVLEGERATPVYFQNDHARVRYSTVQGLFPGVPVRPAFQQALDTFVADWWQALQDRGFIRLAAAGLLQQLRRGLHGVLKETSGANFVSVIDAVPSHEMAAAPAEQEEQGQVPRPPRQHER
jgi:hypothetical protein